MESEKLADAVQRGDFESVLALIEAQPDLLQARVRGTTPLLLSIYCGHPALAEALLERGAPLSFAEACAAGRADEVQRLLSGDSSLVDELSADGFPSLGLAIFFGHDEIARLLIERGADVRAHARNPQGVAPIHAAVARGNAALVEDLLDRGVDPDDPQENGFTPLHGAAASGNRELANLLLARGANGSLHSAGGRTAADLAREHGHDELASELDAQTSQ